MNLKNPLYILILLVALSFTQCASEKEPTELSITEKIDEGIAEVLNHINPPRIPETNIDLVAFSGQQPDTTGTYNFQQDINRAIDSLAANGGGSLIFSYPENSSGNEKSVLVYRIKGPILLKSNIGLKVDRSLKLQFEFDPASYRPGGKGVLSRYEGTTLYTHSPLIRGFNVENISITDNGGDGPLPVIDGDGQKWREWEVQGNLARGGQNDNSASYIMAKEINATGVPIPERRFDKEYLRPSIMQFFLSKRILVENIKLVNSPFWTVHPLFSENLTFRGLEFEALVANNDGIDPESSRYILIEDVKFHNADDNVAIKAGRDKEGMEGVGVTGTELEGIDSYYIRDGKIGGSTEYVVVRNCDFRGHYAICIGSEMSGGVNHIYVKDNQSDHRVNMGFYIKGGRNRGGVVSDIYVQNMDLNEVKWEVVRLLPNYDRDTTSPNPSEFKNVYVENITAKYSGRGILINGWADKKVRDVVLKDIRVDSLGQENPLVINHAEDVELINVNIAGHSLDSIYNVSNTAIPVPR